MEYHQELCRSVGAYVEAEKKELGISSNLLAYLMMSLCLSFNIISPYCAWSSIPVPTAENLCIVVPSIWAAAANLLV